MDIQNTTLANLDNSSVEQILSKNDEELEAQSNQDFSKLLSEMTYCDPQLEQIIVDSELNGKKISAIEEDLYPEMEQEFLANQDTHLAKIIENEQQIEQQDNQVDYVLEIANMLLANEHSEDVIEVAMPVNNIKEDASSEVKIDNEQEQVEQDSIYDMNIDDVKEQQHVVHQNIINNEQQPLYQTVKPLIQEIQSENDKTDKVDVQAVSLQTNIVENETRQMEYQNQFTNAPLVAEEFSADSEADPEEEPILLGLEKIDGKYDFDDIKQKIFKEKLDEVKSVDDIRNLTNNLIDTFKLEQSFDTSQQLDSPLNTFNGSMLVQNSPIKLTESPQSNSLLVTDTLPSTNELDQTLDFAENNWQSKLSGQILLMSQNNIQQAKLSLNPPELGPLSITFSMDSNAKASLVLSAVHSTTRDLLESQVTKLQEVLAEEGIELVDVNIDINVEIDFNESELFNGDSSRKSNSAKNLPDNSFKELFVLETAIEEKDINNIIDVEA